MISDSYHWVSDTLHRIFSGNNPGPDTGSVGSSTPTNSTKPNLGLDIPNVPSDNHASYNPRSTINSPSIPNTNPNTPMSAGPNPWTEPNSVIPTSNSTTVTPTSSFFYSFI